MSDTYELRKPTPKALKVYKKHGLLGDGTNKRAEIAARVNVYADVDALKEVLDATFTNDFSEVDLEEIDLQQVGVGIEDFFYSLFARSETSE